MKKLGIINLCAPYSSAAGQESVDLALACATFGQQVSVFFIADGVFQLIANQQPQLANLKAFTKSLAAFEFYDIDRVYVCQQSLLARHIDPSSLDQQVCVAQSQTLQLALSQQDSTLVMK